MRKRRRVFAPRRRSCYRNNFSSAKQAIDNTSFYCRSSHISRRVRLASRAFNSQPCRTRHQLVLTDDTVELAGSGKTLVSIMLIKDVFETLQPGASACKAIFLVPTVGLANQQADVLRQQTPLRVGHYYGALGVDFWRLEDWRKQLEDHDVLVMTYQVLLNALSAGFIKV